MLEYVCRMNSRHYTSEAVIYKLHVGSKILYYFMKSIFYASLLSWASKMEVKSSRTVVYNLSIYVHRVQ